MLRRPVAFYDDIALMVLGGHQLVIHIDIVAGAVYLYVVAVADDESPVGILVVDVVLARRIDERVGLVMLTVPVDVVNAHRGVADVEHLIFVVLVACVEYQVAVVLPLYLAHLHIGRFGVHALGVLPSVLHHHRSYLVLHVGDVEAVVVHCHRHLVVAQVEVDVCVRRHAQSYVYHWLHHLKFGTEHFRIVVVFVIDVQPVVAAHLHPAALVGYL